MRRTDREVKDFREQLDILRRCDTVRIGMYGDGFPYIVPVSFGAEEENGRAVVYFHCAVEGMKTDLLRRDARVCVEGDIFLGTERTDHGITTRYESVIGQGTCEFLTGRDEIIRGLKSITDHYGYFDFPLSDCRALEYVLVGRVVLDSLTGKRNLPPEK